MSTFHVLAPVSIVALASALTLILATLLPSAVTMDDAEFRANLAAGVKATQSTRSLLLGGVACILASLLNIAGIVLILRNHGFQLTSNLAMPVLGAAITAVLALRNYRAILNKTEDC